MFKLTTKVYRNISPMLVSGLYLVNYSHSGTRGLFKVYNCLLFRFLIRDGLQVEIKVQVQVQRAEGERNIILVQDCY